LAKRRKSGPRSVSDFSRARSAFTRPDAARALAQQCPGFRLELGRAVCVRRIGQEQAQQHAPARPPQMERGRVAVPDRLLPRGVLGDDRLGKVHLGQAFAFLGDHELVPNLVPC
jgi:hypothetical protein